MPFSYWLTIRADRAAIRDAQESGDASALTAAKAKLTADRAQIKSDTDAATAKLNADAAPFKATIKADRQAIQDKLESLDSKLAPLFDKVQADQTSFADKLKTDRDAVQADLAKLKADRAAASNG